MKIALYYRHIDPADLPAFDYLCAELKRAGVFTYIIKDGDTLDSFDYLFSIGGDGTLLSAVQLLSFTSPFPPSGSLPSIVGINFGHLGFLTTAGKENLSTLVADLLENRFTVEERTLLQIQNLEFKIQNSKFALNEVFVHRREEASLLRTQVFVDGDYVATYAGDGVIVATPTGSTAYSLSCGGPILTPTSRCFAITPISAHTLTLRPIIIPDTAHITLSLQGPEFSLGIDSHRHTLQGDTTIELSRAPFTVKLIRISSQNFFSAIRDKLMWGTEVRM